MPRTARCRSSSGDARARANWRLRWAGLLRQVDTTLFADGLRTVEEDAAQFVAPARLITLLLSLFAAMGLLAALGVFGTMTCNVSQRARELAIRSALGEPEQQARMVIERGLIVTLAGVVPGIGIALLTSRALRSFLYGVSPADPWTLAGVVETIVVSIVASCGRPPRPRPVDPMAILRRE